MAGIGFELKKIFKEESILQLTTGVAYSSVVVVGPTIFIIGTILALYIVLGFTSVSYYERELLSSTILYAFIFSLLITAPFNGVMSRYIADKIYEENYEDILPSFYMGLFLAVLLGSLIGLPFIYRVIFVGKVDLFFASVSYLLFIALIITLYSMTYLSATKDYKFIAIFYAVGMFIAFLLSILFSYFGLSAIKAILYGLTIGFLLIALLEFSYMKKYFSTNSQNYTGSLHYFKTHKHIWMSHFFYVVGLYIHNFVFWTHPSNLVIAKSYVSMQSYDMASFLAMFTNISTLILFTVMAETKFHTKYQKYNEAVTGKTWEEIEMHKDFMFKLLVKQLSYILSIQFIITGVIYLIAMYLFPRIGFSGSILLIYPSLVAAFLAIFLMYSNTIFMAYFDDNKGASLTSMIFALAVLIGSLITVNFSVEYYGLGAFVGAFVGWSFSFFRLRHIEKNFDEHIFCRVQIIEKKKGPKPSNVVYKRAEN